MNKLLFSEGGQPLHLDDLNFMQEAFLAPLKGLVNAFGDCLLAGAELRLNPDTSAYTVSAGYISYQGDVYYLGSKTFEQVDQSNAFYLIFSSAEGEEKEFEDGLSHNTQVVYTAELVSTREAPEGRRYLLYDSLPRLGADFARRPHMRASYEGVGLLAEFRELSRYSGILTLSFDSRNTFPVNGYFGLLSLGRILPSGGLQTIHNMQGRCTHVSNSVGSAIVITLLNGKLSAKWENPPTDGSYISHIGFGSKTKVSMIIEWDDELDNGVGAGISEGTGSSYSGRGRSIYDEPRPNYGGGTNRSRD